MPPSANSALRQPGLTMVRGTEPLVFDYDELERSTRIGYERGMRSRKGER
jgi:hypothetical protein